MAYVHARPWVGFYVLPSTLLVRDCDGSYERTVGDGLFTSVRLARGALVGWMNGELVDREMYDLRCSGGRGGYGILVRGGLVLDCYEEYLLGRCPNVGLFFFVMTAHIVLVEITVNMSFMVML